MNRRKTARPGGRRRARHSLIGVVLLLCMTLPHLDQGDVRKDTARYAAVSLQMWETGDFLTPRLHPDTLYFKKPPLAFWMVGGVLKAAGTSLTAIRLPSVLAAALCVLVLVSVVRAFGSEATAATAGIVLALTMDFFRRTREFSIDLWLLLFLLLAFRLAIAGARGRAGWLAASGASLGAALLCKPLVALLALPVLFACYDLFRPVRSRAWLLAAAAAALIVGGSWHVAAAAVHGDAFFVRYFGNELREHTAEAVAGEGIRPLYYLGVLGIAYWPWLAAVAAAAVPAFRGRFGARARRALAAAALWVLVWLAALSVFPQKEPQYALPLYPMLAWIAEAA